MNAKVKKGIFWTVNIATMILVMNVFHFLFGGLRALADGFHGHGPKGMTPHHGWGPQHMGHQHYNGFSWFGFLLFLIVGLVVLFLVVKWLRRKSKVSSMQTFIDTSLMSSQRPISTQKASVLDQWENNVMNKKGE
ncbi:hypothetical protein [Bacillus sp. Marseille-P3661]|uniref:hypothetical protein n=1 Tax=Bacillus sp. Marseille-P3661 TaxID=1936234 RepID=UPI000C823069|nr:hypothetical protein [Bacillus sp. Marseille-P3661]